MKKFVFATLISSLFLSGFTQDVHGHWYLGTELGFTGFDDYSFDDDYRRKETGGVSFGVFGGYQINPYLAVQMGATSVSTIDIRVNHHGDDYWVSEGPTSNYNTLDFFAIGRIPMGRTVALLGMAGIQHYDFDHDYLRNSDYQLQRTNGSDGVLGIGLEWFYNRNLFSRITFKKSDVTAEYVNYRGTGRSDVKQGQVSFSVAYRF